MKSFSRRALLAVVAGTLPALLLAHTTANAGAAPSALRRHLALSKSEPSANDTTTASPKAIKLWFTESVQLAATAVKLTDAAKHDVPLGAITIAAAAKSPAVAEIKAALKPGKYTVDWKTMAADGHPNKGTFVFTVGAKAAH